MDAIGLNPIKLDAIGLDPIRMNAIRLGVPGASSGSGRPYIDPELLTHVKMAISTWGKTNDDPDRAVLKDLSGNGNDMRLLNFGFAEGSGYGLYGTDFSKNWILTNPSTPSVLEKQTITFTRNGHTGGVFFAQIHNSTKVDIPSFKVNVDFYPTNNHPNYYYWDEKGVRQGFPLNKGINVLPANYASKSNDSNLNGSGFHDNFNETVIIEQLPDFEGWLCTDGVEDLIESVKPVSEILEGSNEITVVSIIHQISFRGISSVPLTNYIRLSDAYIRNNVSNINKTGIYGYTCSNIKKSSSSNSSVINNILGDKNDYSIIETGDLSTGKFSVQGYMDASGRINELSQVAYAGGFIANKVLTTDEINQIIAYFNLDRPGQIIKPQLYCNIKKQGITNDNHAEFNDQLIDFVGGHNIQLNNVAWEKQSGIGNYPISFKDYTYLPTRATVEVSKDNFIIKANTDNNNFLEINTKSKSLPNYKVKVQGINTIVNGTLYYKVNDGSTIHYTEILEDGEYEIPESSLTEISKYSGWAIIGGFNDNVNVKVTVLPKEGSEYALYLDGISDFGKATGLPILKDYTVVADRKIIGNNNGGILSKSYAGDNGAFIFETGSVNYSFGTVTQTGVQSNRMLSYLSKYIYNGSPIQVGTGIDRDSMWLGTIRDGDPRFSKLALWSLMLFPYSLSEFLLERQLRKYKAGTLYPDMIEFRPIVKSNIPYSSVSYSVNPGEYIAEGSAVTITITLSNASDKLVGVSSNAISDISISGDNGVYEVTGKVTKSPQKINIVISSYLTTLGNETLISNETLIKNE